MSKTRKILSVVLALVMVFSVLSVSASAAANYESEEDLAEFGYNQVWEIKEDENDGSESIVTVNVYLTTNYPTGSIQFVVNNTNPAAAVLDYENVALGSGITYAAEIKANANGKVLIVPETTADTVTAPTLDNALVATLKYTVGTGSATLTIKDDEKTAETPAGTLIAARMDDGDIVTGNPVVGQPATVTGEVNIGATAAAPELVAIDGTIGVVDRTRTTIDADNGIECDGYLYGVDPYDAYETVDTVFEVLNGSMEIVANEAGSECGTGTMVKVLDNDGNVVETYVLIIFGDVNGDGEANDVDCGDIDLHSAYMLNDDTGRLLAYQEFAGDVNVDGEATDLDAGDIDLHSAYMLNEDSGRLVISDIIAAL